MELVLEVKSDNDSDSDTNGHLDNGKLIRDNDDGQWKTDIKQ